MLLQPLDVSPLGTLLDLTEELDHLRLETRLARIVHGNHHLNLDSHDITIRMDPTYASDTFSGYVHGYPSSKKSTVTSEPPNSFTGPTRRPGSRRVGCAAS